MASVEAVEQARAVLERLERIEALKGADTPPGVLLNEVRSLLTEAEAWVEADRPGPVAEEALDRCRDAVDAGERASSNVVATG